MKPCQPDMITSHIVLDSVGPSGKRLTTFEATFPRFILAELNTHRMLSRNAASSRAIPTEKLIQSVLDNPAMPVYWGKNQRGMQAAEEIDPVNKVISQEAWLSARDKAVQTATALHTLGVHKQIVNRVLEPWMHVTVIISATEYNNFFKLRAHKDAQPEIRVLAEGMLQQYTESIPEHLNAGEWHLPYVTVEERREYPEGLLKHISTARCARVSYVRQLEVKAPQEDVAFCQKLSSSGHWSPFEHVAQASPDVASYGNFVGWRQWRKSFVQESGSDFPIASLLPVAM